MSIHLFTGEAWLRGRAIARLKRELRQSSLSWSEVLLDGEEFSLERFVEALKTSSLFDEGIIIHLKRADRLPDADSLIPYLESPLPKERCLILEVEKLDKRGRLYQTIVQSGEIHDYPPPDRRSLPALTNELLRERGVRLSPQGLRYLLESVEGNLHRIGNEVEKLALYAHGRGRELSLEDLKELLYHDQGGDLFGFLNAFFERRPQTPQLLRELLDGGEEAGKVFFLLAAEVRALLKIRSLAAEGLSNDEIARMTGDYPWRAAKRRQRAERLAPEELLGLLHRLHEEDLKLKRGERQPEEALWALVLEWAFQTTSGS